MRSRIEIKTHPVARLTENGIDWGVWPGPGDETGYAMQPYRLDDCFQAAIATCTQVPIEQVPDLNLGRRFERGEDPEEISRSGLERIAAWSIKQGTPAYYFDKVPLPLERWIGVVERGLPAGRRASHPFQDHCLVMRHDEVLFDPACGIPLPPGATDRVSFDLSDVSYGIAFLKEE